VIKKVLSTLQQRLRQSDLSQAGNCTDCHMKLVLKTALKQFKNLTPGSSGVAGL